ETLEAAAKSVRRAVIPRLKSQLQGQLSPITNGRYRDVRIGEDLALQVRTQDQRTYKDVDNLSLGTRSLIYLLERLALARIIGGNSEPPPLLHDEALVHADRRRLRAAMDELGRLDHQVILFSKDEALADRAEKSEDWTIIRLPGPSVAAPTEGAPANGSSRDEIEQEVPSALGCDRQLSKRGVRLPSWAMSFRGHRSIRASQVKSPLSRSSSSIPSARSASARWCRSIRKRWPTRTSPRQK